MSARKTVDTSETTKEIRPIVVQFGKVQSIVTPKYDSWHKDAFSKYSSMLCNEMTEFHAHISKFRSELEQQSIDTAKTSEAVGLITQVQALKRKMKVWEKQVDFKEDRSNKPGRATRKSNITEKQTPQPSSSSSTHRPQQQSSSELPKARVIVAELAPQPSTSSSTQQQSLRRERKTKFVGRRISQQWTEDDGSTKWYNGTVLSVINGKDGDPKAIYQVQYDNEQDSYDVDSLTADYKEGTLKFIDL